MCVSGVKPPAERQRPKDARGTPGRTAEPLAVHIFPRLPRKSDRQSGRDQGTPDGRQRDTGVYSRALGSAHCPTPATQKPAAERRRPRDTGRTPEGHRGVHPTLGSAHCPTPATQKPAAERRRPRDTGRTLGGHWGVQPSPWQCTVSHACRALGSAQWPTPPTQKRPAERQRPRDTGRTPEGHACHAKQPAERRRPRDTGRTPEGHRGVQPSAQCPTPATQKPPVERRRPRDTGQTPERHRCVQPSPWQFTLSHACHAKATDRAAETKGHRTTPEGHRGVHPTPGQRTLSHACHAKASGRAAETKGDRTDARGTPGRTSNPVAVHIVPRLPRKSDRRPRNASETPADTGAYIRPCGSAHCPTPVSDV